MRPVLHFASTSAAGDELGVEGLADDILDTVFPASTLRYVPEIATRPSGASKKSFGELKSGWQELTDWGALNRWPLDPPAPAVEIHDDVRTAIKQQIASWFAFRKNWDTGKQDTTALEAQSIDLEVAKNVAAEFGFPGEYHARQATNDRPGTDTKVHKPDIEDQSLALGVAAKTQEGVDTAKSAANAVGDLGAKIPLAYKVGAVALVAGVVVIAAKIVIGR